MAKTPRHYIKQNTPKGWRFGIDQTAKQEIAEIRKARHLGSKRTTCDGRTGHGKSRQRPSAGRHASGPDDETT